MEFYQHKPQPPLAQHVDHFWLVDAAIVPYPRQNLFPDGGITILFSLADPHYLIDRTTHERQVFRDAWIAGERLGPYLIETPGSIRIAGVRFKPGGARPFIPFPAKELTGLVLPLNQVLGSVGVAYHERMFAARTPQEIFEQLSQFLTAVRCGDPSVNNNLLGAVINELHGLAPSASIVQLAKRLGTSHRSLLRMFDDWVGMRPKMLQRIVRFQRAIGLEDSRDNTDWATIAHRCGYYDQAHLIRDFKILSGMTPRRYRQLRLEYPNYAPEI